MDLKDFPFDQQLCNITFASTALPDDEVQLMFHEPRLQLIESVSISGYIMTNNYTSHTVASSLLLDGKRRTLLSWGIKMKRLTSPYITAYYVPSTFIVMLAFVSFWIPAAAHPARVALVVTNFLASCVIYRGADSNTPLLIRHT